MSIWQFRYRKSSQLKTNFKEEGDNRVLVELGKDFQQRYADLKTETGKRRFLEELKRTKGGEKIGNDRYSREFVDQVKKSLDQQGINRVHRIKLREN